MRLLFDYNLSHKSSWICQWSKLGSELQRHMSETIESVEAQSKDYARQIWALAVDTIFGTYPEEWKSGLVGLFPTTGTSEFGLKMLTLSKHEAVAGIGDDPRDVVAKGEALYRILGSLHYAIRDWLGGFDHDMLVVSPARELVRTSEIEWDTANWHAKWTAAGGALRAGRMIALKPDPVWVAISDFGMPFPPYSAENVMWIEDVSEEESMQLGLPQLKLPISMTWTMNEERFKRGLTAGVDRVVAADRAEDERISGGEDQEMG